jgi:hypothetical protein
LPASASPGESAFSAAAAPPAFAAHAPSALALQGKPLPGRSSGKEGISHPKQFYHISTGNLSMSAVQKVRRIHLKLKSSLISPPKIQKEVTF